MVLKLKLSAFTRLPINAIAAPVDIETILPTRRGIICPVEIIDTCPYRMLAENIQARTPHAISTMAAEVAATLFVFFQATAREIGTTAEPIKIPIAR
jgi:hypothetical protein